MEWIPSSEASSEVLVLDCKDVDRLLGEYVDGELPRHLAHEMDGHLERCSHCREAADDYMKVVELAASLRSQPEPVLVDVQNRLRAALNTRLGLQIPYID